MKKINVAYLLGCMHENCKRIKEEWEQQNEIDSK